MDARREFVRQGLVDETLARHPALSDERGGNDRDGEMRLAARAGPLMADMSMRLILHLESGRSQPFHQLAADRFGDGHR